MNQSSFFFSMDQLSSIFWLVCVRACMDLYEKKKLVVKPYLMNLSLKFRTDLCFRSGDIQLLVTMYIQYFTLNSALYMIW